MNAVLQTATDILHEYGTLISFFLAVMFWMRERRMRLHLADLLEGEVAFSQEVILRAALKIEEVDEARAKIDRTQH